MAELKTKRTDGDVSTFLGSIADEDRRADASAVCALIEQATGETPALWGSGLVGFGRHRYVYESGREGDWFVVGFAPRKQSLVLYLAQAFPGRDELLGRLGKHTTGKGCVYVKKLADVDQDVLRELIAASAAHMRGASA